MKRNFVAVHFVVDRGSHSMPQSNISVEWIFCIIKNTDSWRCIRSLFPLDLPEK